MSAINIANGNKDKLIIGDLDVKKEFNYAGDIVTAIWQLVSQNEVSEMVIGSGVAYNIRIWIEYCFNKLGLNWEEHTIKDEKFVKEGLKEFMNLTPEEIEQASYEFDNASVFQKKQWAESFKEKFENKNKEMLKQLTSSQSENQAKSEALVEKYRTELDGYSQTIVNKEMYGLKITDEMSKNLKDYIDKEFTLQKADGSFDVEKMYSIAMWLKHGADLVKANVTKARNEGKEQVIREVINPSRNFTNVGKNVGSGLEAAQEAFNTLFPG
jgi:hypothetical protein